MTIPFPNDDKCFNSLSVSQQNTVAILLSGYTAILVPLLLNSRARWSIGAKANYLTAIMLPIATRKLYGENHDLAYAINFISLGFIIDSVIAHAGISNCNGNIVRSFFKAFVFVAAIVLNEIVGISMKQYYFPPENLEDCIFNTFNKQFLIQNIAALIGYWARYYMLPANPAAVAERMKRDILFANPLGMMTREYIIASLSTNSLLPANLLPKLTRSMFHGTLDSILYGVCELFSDTRIGQKIKLLSPLLYSGVEVVEFTLMRHYISLPVIVNMLELLQYKDVVVRP